MKGSVGASAQITPLQQMKRIRKESISFQDWSSCNRIRWLCSCCVERWTSFPRHKVTGYVGRLVSVGMIMLEGVSKSWMSFLRWEVKDMLEGSHVYWHDVGRRVAVLEPCRNGRTSVGIRLGGWRMPDFHWYTFIPDAPSRFSRCVGFTALTCYESGTAVRSGIFGAWSCSIFEGIYTGDVQRNLTLIHSA